MDKKQIEMLRLIYDEPVPLSDLCSMLNTDEKNFHKYYSTLETVNLYWCDSAHPQKLVCIYPEGREAVEAANAELEKIKREKATVMIALAALGISLLTFILQGIELIVQSL